MNKLVKKIEVGVAAGLITLASVFTFTSSASAKSIEGQSNAQLSGKIAHHPLHSKHISNGIKKGITPKAALTSSGPYTPAQIKKAYGIDQINGTGAGQTIALVEAYGSPTIKSDLDTFNKQWGLPAANIEVAYPSGTPKTDGGWALETALDVEWAHAIAPDAKLLVVSAKSASITDLLAAEDYATNHGATVVSNSWGGSEFSSEAYYDSHFNHSGVTYLASSGDDGAGSSFPASSPNVVAVGGTSLNIGSDGSYISESAWSGSGGQTSKYESIPSYQNNWKSIVGSKRGIPDVSFDADPNTGVYVYTSTATSGQKGWFQIGGTSFSAPAWGGLVALANEKRSQPLSSAQVLNAVYSTAGTTNSTGYSTYFHDITSGSNGIAATAGYDLATGIGTPIANKFIPLLSTK